MKCRLFLLVFSVIVLGSIQGCQSLSVKPLTIEADQPIEELTVEEPVHEMEQVEAEPVVPAPVRPPLPPKSSYLHVMAVGDIMMHMPQVDAGWSSKGYDFASYFEDVKPLFAQADLVLGNLETTLSGPDVGFSGYPRFNSPDELADALQEAGFDVMTTANNHSLDRGEKGLKRTLEQLQRVGLKHTGTFKSAEDRNNHLIVTKNYISVAMLSYTYGTNGLPVPAGKEYLVNLLDEQKMERDIKKVKEMGADIVAVSIHFGHEYHRKPSEDQKEWVNRLFQWGADLIFGSHPHVVQPFEVRKWVTEEGQLKQGVVIYSLGNFISNQRKEPRDIGGIISVQIQKTGDSIDIQEVQFIPTWVHRYWNGNNREYRILPMRDMLEIRDYTELNEERYQRLEQRYLEMMNHVTPERIGDRNASHLDILF
jgi:poly-gamma-glutamate capsule biosynthesis protein CapA/YwtB (metallophosphatase superfamily)